MGTLNAVMFDDVNLDLLPAGADVYAAYSNGRYTNVAAVRAKFPKAIVLTIDIAAHYAASDVLDVETGDAVNADAPGWFHARVGKTATPKPVLYTSAANVAALVQTMTFAGISRDAYFIWSAHYSGVQHICGTCGYPQADATQWTDHSQGRSLDESLINDYVLPGGDMALTNDDVAAILSGKFQVNGEWVSLADALTRCLVNDKTCQDELAALKAQIAALPQSSGTTVTQADVDNIATAAADKTAAKFPTKLV